MDNKQEHDAMMEHKECTYTTKKTNGGVVYRVECETHNSILWERDDDEGHEYPEDPS